jgi:hypothetical protein
MDARLQSSVRRLKRNRGTTEDMHAPLRFLRNVIFGTTYGDLLHHPDVVGGDGADLRSKNGRFLVDSITRSTGGAEEFAGQGVELGMTAGLRERVARRLKSERETINTHLVVQAAAHSTVSTTLFVQELNKVRLPTTTSIFDRLATLREELYRRE